MMNMKRCKGCGRKLTHYTAKSHSREETIKREVLSKSYELLPSGNYCFFIGCKQYKVIQK